MMFNLSIGGRVFAHSDLKRPNVQSLLHVSRDEGLPITCHCKGVGTNLRLYTRRLGDELIVCRMPESGLAHHEDCQFYGVTPPVQFLTANSKLEAVREDESGAVHISLDASLTVSTSIESKTTSSTISRGAGHRVRAERLRKESIDILGLLHYLWDAAKLNRWYTAMQGKRSWREVSYHLSRAAANVHLGKVALTTRLAIMPSQSIFNFDQFLITNKLKRGRDVFFVIGEVKNVTEKYLSIGGSKLYLWFTQSMRQYFESELIAANVLTTAGDGTIKIIIAGVVMSDKGFLQVQFLKILVVSDRYMPILSLQEKYFSSYLHSLDRAFMIEQKGKGIKSSFYMLDCETKRLLVIYKILIKTEGVEFSDVECYSNEGGGLTLPDKVKR